MISSVRHAACLLSTLFLCAMQQAFAGQVPTTTASTPTNMWSDGETLVYSVQWGVVIAAQGTFTATEKPDRWEFRLHLVSEGVVETFFPINSWFWSFQEKNPWRSVEYGEDRSEGNRRIRERTQVDYTAKTGVREKWNKGETDHFAITVEPLDDIGSMLYALRRIDWKLGEKRPIAVHESSRIKTGEATCVSIEKHICGTWPEQELIKLYCEPTGETKQKQKGHLTLWLTNDARHLPLEADLSFKYGTFEIILLEVK